MTSLYVSTDPANYRYKTLQGCPRSKRPGRIVGGKKATHSAHHRGSRNALSRGSKLQIAGFSALCGVVIDQLADRRARFQPCETLVDFVKPERARDQVIEFQPALAPQRQQPRHIHPEAVAAH